MTYIHWIRSRVGNQKVFIPFTSVILYNDVGHILLQRRADMDVWGLPGGVLEPGEEIQACARRELLEETGLAAGELHLVGLYCDPRFDSIYPNGDQVQQYTICLSGQLAGGEMQPDGIESSWLDFFAPGRLPLDQMPPWYRAMLADELNNNTPAFQPPDGEPITISQIAPFASGISLSGYLAATTVGVCINPQGHILMVNRPDGAWSFPAGYLRLGENAAQTIVRETYAQTGIQTEPVSLLGVHTPATLWQGPQDTRVQPVISVFRLHSLQRAESGWQTWMSPEQILGLPAPPDLVQVHTLVLHQLQSGGAFIL